MIEAALLTGILTVIVPPTALASQPVPRTLVGCVAAGVFTSSDGYEIAIATAIGASVDLRPHEGRRLRIEGALLPGDNLILKAPPRDLGPCPGVAPPAR